jgi:hypothetical protein
MPRWAWVSIGAPVAALAAATAFAYAWDRGRADVIAPGTQIAGVEVGGLHTARARARAQARIADRLQRPLRLTADGHDLELYPAGLGLHVDVSRMVDDALQQSRGGGIVTRIWRAVRHERSTVDVPLRAGVRAGALAQAANAIAASFARPARPARVVPTASKLLVVPERPGLAVQRSVLLRTLATALLSPDGPHVLAVPTKIVEPRWTTKTLAKRYPSYLLIDREHYTLRLYRHLRLVRVYPIAVGRAGLETLPGSTRSTTSR